MVPSHKWPIINNSNSEKATLTSQMVPCLVLVERPVSSLIASVDFQPLPSMEFKMILT